MTMYSYLNSNTEIIDQFINTIIPPTLTINCNEKQNKINPRCFIDKINPIIQNIQTDIPKYIKELQNNIQSYSAMVINAKISYLKNLVKNFSDFQDIYFSNIKSLLENATIILNYLSNNSGTSNKQEDTIKNQEYINCRKDKRNSLGVIINIIKPYLQCPSLINNITSKVDNMDIEEKLKYFLFLINEISKNAESFDEELFKIILDASFCLQENFDEY